MRESGGRRRLQVEIAVARGDVAGLGGVEARRAGGRSGFRGPAAGDEEVAAGAAAVVEEIFLDALPGAADEERLAGWAVGVGGVAVDVALVDEVQAGFESDGAGAVKSFGRGAGLVLKLEIGMKGGEVKRNVGAEIFEEPIAKAASLAGIVVESGDHEIGNFEPDIGLVLEPFECVEDGSEMGESGAGVETFGEGLEVHVGGVNVVVNIVERFAGDVAVGDHDGAKAVFPGEGGDVDDVFAPDGGLIVGEGDGGTGIGECQGDNILGRDVGGANLVCL